MANKRKKKKAKESDLHRLAIMRPFLDAYDTYVDEFERWTKMEVVKGLLGVFELDDEDYLENETNDLLPKLGLESYEQLFYNVEVDNRTGHDENSTAGGWTSAVRDRHGRVRPIIFVRRVIPRHPDDEEEPTEESAAAHKLIVLIHEMGHADDIRKSVNYNHETLELDIIAAETYAHEFVVRNCRKLGYRLALAEYLRNIELQLSSKNDAARIAAERFTDNNDLDDIREFTVINQSVIKSSLQKSGRMKEFQHRYPG